VIARTPPLATLHDLDTVYGLEDLHDMLEVMTVDALNQEEVDRQARIEARLAAQRQERERR
jgi:hypothetical protein